MDLYEKSSCRSFGEAGFPEIPYNAKLIQIWSRFSLEATYTISYRFLREATGYHS